MPRRGPVANSEPLAPEAALRSELTLEAGRGRAVTLPTAASTVVAADPRIARVQPTSPTSLVIIGVSAGRTTILAAAESGATIAEYLVTVRGGNPPAGASAPAAAPAPAAARPSAAAIQAAIRQAVPTLQGLGVQATASAVILTGTAATASEAQRAEAVAKAFAGEDGQVLNEIEVMSSIQVNLRVRVMEISREITRELGFNWQALANSGNFVLGLRSGAAAASVISGLTTGTATLGAPTRFGAGVTSSRFDINAIVDALAQDRLATILAEPNLTAQSGETASFLAGGEFPIPVAASQIGQITIQFKQFGVSLAFVPTVLGPDRINLRVRPEVSELSENGSITVPLGAGTVRIPALAVRRAETTVELGSGQSFAIAGLLQRSSSQVSDGVAGLGEVPVLGALFRSERFRRSESELVIIVTPYLVRPVSDPRRLAGPTDGFRPATDLDRLLHARQVARGLPHQPLPTERRDAGFILE
ncbi:type II and III secretion system protein family protein [Falsiroseomonas tokyonensis]|uniref:Type II and III secretion system protein family protein n=1 Tax=Falsiroseomonas tokyonensis TaxID=430521 RepID=A0ABV7BTC0_9PROT|nr:type II and III secretion system protein family protein [Falsiroseomonas tokyonensis]MBU8537352.1 type II and III secretion system protein family protein [Falsiroseomonas tokyonensis]